MRDGLRKFDALLRVGWQGVFGELQGPVVMLAGGVIGLIEFAIWPMRATFGAIEPHLHVFDGRVVV